MSTAHHKLTENNEIGSHRRHTGLLQTTKDNRKKINFLILNFALKTLTESILRRTSEYYSRSGASVQQRLPQTLGHRHGTRIKDIPLLSV